MSDDKKRDIEVRAYELWQSEGQPHGKHEEHWRRAVREIEGEDSGISGHGRRVRRAGQGASSASTALLRRRRSSRKSLKAPDPVLFDQKRRALSRQAKAKLAEVEQRLARFYTADDMRAWLMTPHVLLGGKRAINLISKGQTDRVLAVIDSLADGSYT